MSEALTLEPRGPFSLCAAAEFGFGPNQGRPPAFDGAMFNERALAWRPFRTWATVLVRMAGDREFGRER
jgi:hypothetical protein